MNHSEQLNELAKALATAQSAIKPAIKDSTNPHFRSQYADLASVWEACRAALTANGLSVAQGCSAEGPAVRVETMLLHSSGQWISDGLTLQALNGSPQAIGSAITYGRRYGLAAIVGIAPDDDDGEAAHGRGQGTSAAEKRAAEPDAPAKPAPEPPAAPGEPWQGEDTSGRAFVSTGQPLPNGWFARAKENRAAALEEIGGKDFWGAKNPTTGKFEIVRYL